MEVKVKVDPFDRCATCRHPSHDHLLRGGRCCQDKCVCTVFVPYEPQVIKEVRWIFHNFVNAKTDAEKKKWHEKMEKWGKAHPDEYRSLLRDLLNELRARK